MDEAISKTDPSQSEPLNRHRSSLEGIIDFSVNTPLKASQRAQAERWFYQIVEYFKEPEPHKHQQGTTYSRPLLIRYTYEYALSQESRDVFLRPFFRSMGLSLDADGDLVELEDRQVEDLRSAFFAFADHLLDNFFLPLKASTKKTPQPSPAYHSAVLRAQGSGMPLELVGTPDRVSALRGACLVRDHHRCVVSRLFDHSEALHRFKRDGEDARDDDGHLLREERRVDTLEVAHILPHSLTKAQPGAPLDPSREAALAVLNMFDVGVAYLIEGSEIDRPRNAMTLTHTLHDLLGEFRIFFEPASGDDQPPHTYRIGGFLPRFFPQDPPLPITRTLYLSENRTIETPSPRLLAVHRAIALILHLSAAGSYIDQILRDVEEYGIRADGSTELGRLVTLGLKQSSWGVVDGRPLCD
ncbi:hypothetical protein B0T18DRAFT_321154 [Schizothecium vesticola]|uniref:HNH nuclease domain-containing protein n=1 Tax=Schizothecium vesticola TaxID=314040 RepID=A0AA40F115_9PEZI|nr:hypothetical protein B0T18DRAFT_321154 [Schizothecium vesticola]